MRPDEHKRKQRADYKKKHGIPSKKALPKGDKETSKDKREAQHLENVDLGEIDQVKFNCHTNVLSFPFCELGSSICVLPRWNCPI